MIILGEQVSMAVGFVSLILAKVRKCLGFKTSSEHELVAGNTDIERTSNELAEINNLTEKIMGKILGLTDEIIEQYIQYLADKRLHAVGLEKIYNVEHPIKWVDNFSQFNDQKTNFFEGNVTNYSKGSLDLDDF